MSTTFHKGDRIIWTYLDHSNKPVVCYGLFWEYTIWDGVTAARLNLDMHTRGPEGGDWSGNVVPASQVVLAASVYDLQDIR